MKRLSLLVVLALLIAACGGDDAEDRPPTAASVALDDFSFTPANLRVAADGDITITASNIGGIQHSWVLIGHGEEIVSTDQITPDRVLASTGDLNTGQSESVTFAAPAPGTYQVVCWIDGHVEANMVGTLEVSG